MVVNIVHLCRAARKKRILQAFLKNLRGAMTINQICFSVQPPWHRIKNSNRIFIHLRMNPMMTKPLYLKTAHLNVFLMMFLWLVRGTKTTRAGHPGWSDRLAHDLPFSDLGCYSRSFFLFSSEDTFEAVMVDGTDRTSSGTLTRVHYLFQNRNQGTRQRSSKTDPHIVQPKKGLRMWEEVQFKNFVEKFY